jgi:hypothetical protein
MRRNNLILFFVVTLYFMGKDSLAAPASCVHDWTLTFDEYSLGLQEWQTGYTDNDAQPYTQFDFGPLATYEVEFFVSPYIAPCIVLAGGGLLLCIIGLRLTKQQTTGANHGQR